MKWGIIYKATNKKNGKIYIGQTTQTLNMRKKSHLLHSASTTKRKYAFQSALHKYGEASFTWEVIDTAESEEELNIKEMYWIAHFNTYRSPKNGYNQTPGGKAFPDEELPVLQYDYKGNLIKEHESILTASRAMGGDHKSIKRNCLKESRLYQGCIFVYKDMFESPEALSNEIVGRVKEINQHLLGTYYVA